MPNSVKNPRIRSGIALAVFSCLSVLAPLSSAYANDTVVDWYASGGNAMFDQMNTVGHYTQTPNPDSGISDGSGSTSSGSDLPAQGEYVRFWYDSYFVNMKDKEDADKKKMDEMLDRIANKGQFVPDDRANTLNQYASKTYADSPFWVLGIKFKGTTYFKLGNDYVVLYPYSVVGNTNFVKETVVKRIQEILSKNGASDSEKLDAIKVFLTNYKIKFFMVSESDDNRVKLLLGERRGTKMEAEGQKFFVDKFYRMDVIPKEYIHDGELLIYTVLDKNDLKKTLAGTEVFDQIQPYIKIGSLVISLDYLNGDGYYSVGKYGKIKVAEYGPKKVYKISETSTPLYVWIITGLLSVFAGVGTTWLYYQKKYKRVFQKISESV